MRGSTFFNNLFNDKKSPSVVRRGRSSILVQKRNELLLLRYYFYGNFTDKRYSAIMSTLSAEFFLSESRVYTIVNENTQLLHEIIDAKPTLAKIRAKFPHINWQPSA